MATLQNIRDFGCRILVLSSSMIDKGGNLIIENEFQEAIPINMKKLYDMLKPKGENTDLNIDLVFINVINGKHIAEVF